MSQLEKYIQDAAEMAVKMRSTTELEKFYNFLLSNRPVELVNAYGEYTAECQAPAPRVLFPQVTGVKTWNLEKGQALPTTAGAQDFVKFPNTPGTPDTHDLGVITVSTYVNCRRHAKYNEIAEAIKYLRGEARIGLKAAKDAIDFWFPR